MPASHRKRYTQLHRITHNTMSPLAVYRVIKEYKKIPAIMQKTCLFSNCFLSFWLEAFWSWHERLSRISSHAIIRPPCFDFAVKKRRCVSSTLIHNRSWNLLHKKKTPFKNHKVYEKNHIVLIFTFEIITSFSTYPKVKQNKILKVD